MNMDLIFARGVFLCFFYQNLMRLLFVLFLLRLRVAFQLSYVRRWTRFLFIMVYIGGVLVLAIYTILSSSNWKFPPMRGYLIMMYPLLNLSEGKSSFRFFEGLALSLNSSLILFLLVVLLLGLLLLVKLIKF